MNIREYHNTNSRENIDDVKNGKVFVSPLAAGSLPEKEVCAIEDSAFYVSR